MPNLTTVPTVGLIAERLGVPVHRIRYIVERRRIAAAGRAGNARVFSEADVACIRLALDEIARAKEARHA